MPRDTTIILYRKRNIGQTTDDAIDIYWHKR